MAKKLAQQFAEQALKILENRGRKPKNIYNVKLPYSAETKNKTIMLDIAKSFKSNYNKYKKEILDTYRSYRTDGLEDDLRIILGKLDADNDTATQNIALSVVAVATATNQIALQSWKDITERSLNINLAPFMEYPDSEINKMVDWNTRLIKDMQRSQTKLIRKCIKEAVQNNWSRRQLSEKLEKVLGDNQRSRAKLIATDQVSKLYGAIIRRYSIDSGFTSYRWQTRLDERVRNSHDAMHARICRWDRRDLVAGISRNGKDITWRRRGGGQPIAHPLEQVGCRCIGVPIFQKTKTIEPELIQDLQFQETTV